MASVLIYVSVIAITCFFAYLCEKNIENNKMNIKGKFYAFLTILIPSIIAGIRYYVGTDYPFYANSIFLQICDTNSIVDAHYIFEVEWGYSILNFIISRFTNNPHVIFFIVSFITTGCVFGAIYKYKKYLSISYAMFVYMILYYQLSFNLVRQCLALSIVLLAYAYIFENKYMKGIILIGIATFFHYSAIIALVVIPIKKAFESKYRIVYLTITLLLVTLLFIFYTPIVETILNFMNKILKIDVYRYLRYLETEGKSNFSILIALQRIPFLITPLLCIKSFFNNKKENGMMYFLLVVDLIIAHMSLISNYVQRISFYFAFLKILALPQVVSSIKNTQKKKEISIIQNCFLIGYWVYFYVICNYGNTFPYEFSFYA